MALENECLGVLVYRECNYDDNRISRKPEPLRGFATEKATGKYT